MTEEKVTEEKCTEEKVAEKISVTREDIEKKTEELVELIKNFDGSRSDAAQYICFEVVNWACANHYEGVGILTETLFDWRNASITTINEENAEEEKTDEEKQMENKYEELMNFVVNKWKENGTVKDETSTRNNIEAMFFLLSGYRLECLIETIKELDFLAGKFHQEEEHKSNLN